MDKCCVVVNSRGSGPDCKRVLCGKHNESVLLLHRVRNAHGLHTHCRQSMCETGVTSGHTACDADVERVCCVTAAEKNPLHFYYVGPHLIRAYSAGSCGCSNLLHRHGKENQHAANPPRGRVCHAAYIL